jgi:hypothetical protein
MSVGERSVHDNKRERQGGPVAGENALLGRINLKQTNQMKRNNEKTSYA